VFVANGDDPEGCSRTLIPDPGTVDVGAIAKRWSEHSRKEEAAASVACD